LISAQRNLNKRKEKIRFSCPFCQVYYYPDMEASNKHFAEFHKITGVLPIYCDHCGQGFLNAALLNIHKRIHMCKKICFYWRQQRCHILPIFNFSNRFVIVPEMMKPNTNTKVQLQIRRKNLQPSISEKAPGQRTKLPAQPPLSPPPPLQRENNKKFNCLFCKASFTDKDSVIHHCVSFHKANGALPNYCNECGSGFWSAAELHRHMEIHLGKLSCLSRSKQPSLQTLSCS